MKSQGYQERKYRTWVRSPDLVTSSCIVKETDLLISANPVRYANLKSSKAKLSNGAKRVLVAEAKRTISKYRGQIEEYILKDNRFLTSLEPIDIPGDAPMIVRDMARTASSAGVGPMAAVAGAIAEYVGKDLLKFSEEVIVENGGDIFIKTDKTRRIGIYAGGTSVFTERLAIEVEPQEEGFGVCTSSGTVGHSLSFGKADVATIVACSATLADSVATATGNRVKEPSDVKSAIEFAKSIDGVRGVVIIIGKNLGAWGKVKIINP
jgi:hypothetical protein